MEYIIIPSAPSITWRSFGSKGSVSFRGTCPTSASGGGTGNLSSQVGSKSPSSGSGHSTDDTKDGSNLPSLVVGGWLPSSSHSGMDSTKKGLLGPVASSSFAGGGMELGSATVSTTKVLAKGSPAGRDILCGSGTGWGSGACGRGTGGSGRGRVLCGW